MDVEPSVVKKELVDLRNVAKRAPNIKAVATRLDDIGSDHIPTTQYRAGDQIKTDLLTKVSALIATAKQGDDADAYIKEAQKVLAAALKVKSDAVYSTKLLAGHYEMPSFTLNHLLESVNHDLAAFN